MGDLYAGVQEFQNLIVGIVGFAGVVFTLWFNAREARQQRRDEQRHERETLRVALIEELKIIQESLLRNNDNKTKNMAAFVPTDPMDDVYRAFTHRIGLLSQAEVRKIMYAYLSLRTFNAKLFLIGVPTSTGPHHVQVPVENVTLLYSMQDSLAGPLEEAIEAIEHARAKLANLS